MAVTATKEGMGPDAIDVVATYQATSGVPVVPAAGPDVGEFAVEVATQVDGNLATVVATPTIPELAGGTHWEATISWDGGDEGSEWERELADGDHDVTVYLRDAVSGSILATHEATITIGTAPTPEPTDEPTVEPTAPGDPEPTTAPTGKPTPSPRPEFVRTAPYTLPGMHLNLNGRDWYTTCEPYSQTQRCRTEIWATTVRIVNGNFVRTTGWTFNNLTYLPLMPREAWKGNPLGDTSVLVNGEFVSDGRRWRTECDTAVTGRGGCRSYVMATVYSAAPQPQGGYRFAQHNAWVFNNIVMFEQ